MDYPTIDMLFKDYIIRLKQNKLSQTSKIMPIKPSISRNPFAVFEHPNFFKTYGHAIDKNKPIFILGGNVDNSTRSEYKELYDNCSSCFTNPIYYPLNADVFKPITDEYASVYDNALLVVVNGNDCNQDLETKIRRASEKGITILILVKEDSLISVFTNRFIDNDTIIIKRYSYNDFTSKKEFADIAVGLYINSYKKQKVVQ